MLSEFLICLTQTTYWKTTLDCWVCSSKMWWIAIKKAVCSRSRKREMTCWWMRSNIDQMCHAQPGSHLYSTWVCFFSWCSFWGCDWFYAALLFQLWFYDMQCSCWTCVLCTVMPKSWFYSPLTGVFFSWEDTCWHLVPLLLGTLPAGYHEQVSVRKYIQWCFFTATNMLYSPCWENQSELLVSTWRDFPSEGCVCVIINIYPCIYSPLYLPTSESGQDFRTEEVVEEHVGWLAPPFLQALQEQKAGLA